MEVLLGMRRMGRQEKWHVELALLVRFCNYTPVEDLGFYRML